MSVEQRHLQDDTWLILVEGRLDQALTPQLDAALNELLAAGHDSIIVDLSGTEYINSGGLRSLVSAWRKAGERDGRVVLCNLNHRLSEIFTMVGFDKVFQIYPTLDKAKQSLIAGKEP